MANPNCKWAKPFVNPFTYPDQGYICTLFQPTHVPRSHYYCVKAENKDCNYYEKMMVDKSIWYKSYKYEDDLTVGDVYRSMPDDHKTALREILWHVIKHTRPDVSRLNSLIDCFQSFDENEKLSAYYLVNEAVLNKETVFDKLSWFELLKEIK